MVVSARAVGNAGGVRAAFLGAGWVGYVQRLCAVGSQVMGAGAWGV